MANKVKYGLKNVHYAVAIESNGIITYSTPKAIPGAVNLVQNPAGETVTFYADDVPYFEETTNNGYEGTLEMALVPDEFRIDVFGNEVDSNGALIENSNAKPNKIALMFEFDGDKNRTRHVNYWVSVARPNVEGATRTNTKEPKTETLNITARPALDTSDVKCKLEQGQVGYDTFYSAVYLKNAAINSVESSAVIFSKATPSDVEIIAISSATANAVKNVRLNGIPMPGIHLTASGTNVTISESYVTTLKNDVYTIVAEFNKGNAVSLMLTVKA